MTSRAAFLPYPGDPFLLHYWLQYYKNFWRDEVDKLYIYLNSPIEKEVVDYIRWICTDDDINFQYNPVQIEHGSALNEMLEICTEDNVMLIEDDCFVFKKGKIDECFKYLESGEYDIVGSKRGSCSMEILTRASQLWGIQYEGEGDHGCNFWPNLFFSSREKLLTTDRNFCAKSWKRGEEIPALTTPDYTYLAQDEIVNGDTFVWASLQLQATTPQSRIKYIPQYHGSPDDLDHYARSYNLFDGFASWVHVGSLSSGVGGILQDGEGRALARRTIEPAKPDGTLPNFCHTEQEKWEWERRVQWWKTFWDHREVGEIDEFAQLYLNAINKIIDQYELSRSRIERRQRIYSNVLGL